MPHLGIDIEQFVVDPYASGIQRVLQYLAREWPSDRVSADFVVPFGDGYLLLSPHQAAELVGSAFASSGDTTVRQRVDGQVTRLVDECVQVSPGEALAMFSAWLLPEVSYLPSVLNRLDLFARCMPVTMIGYDALPMTDPANYRFSPGTAGQVSEYFRKLATVDSVVCISDYAREAILDRLRRDRSLRTTVAHPGGDHVPVQLPGFRPDHGPVTFVRLGTLEARKMPVELVEAFRTARSRGAEARLVYVGHPSASDQAINDAVSDAVEEGIGVEWVAGASDDQVTEILRGSDAFISVGIEGYGIPVLEALRRGIPVLYGGIQPAAEIMVGRGAVHVGGSRPQDLSQMFVDFSREEKIAEAAATVDAESVPTWGNFAEHVATAAVD